MRLPYLLPVSVLLFALLPAAGAATAAAPRFKMLVIAELKDPSGEDEIHKPYVDTGKVWLNKLAADSGISVKYIESPNVITDSLLADIDLIWQMNFTPFRWNATSKAAFEKYMNSGKGGWVGQHHAALYGPVLTTETWPFFAKLIGEINYKNYISKFASGDVRVEDAAHPVFAGVPAKFNVTTEEWYTWDKSPRAKVHVLANVDEASYKFVDASQSGTKMGDHPVVWTYDGYKARNIYIFMGHHPNLFHNEAYVTLLRNALFWAANKPVASALRGGAAKVPATPVGAAGEGARDAAGRALPGGGATIRFDRP